MAETQAPLWETPQSGWSAGAEHQWGPKELEKVSWTWCWLLKDRRDGEEEMGGCFWQEVPSRTKAWAEEGWLEDPREGRLQRSSKSGQGGEAMVGSGARTSPGGHYWWSGAEVSFPGPDCDRKQKFWLRAHM